MRGILVVLVAGLVFAPAAVAKGPHAILTSGPDPIEAGAAWESTIELNEFGGAPEPSLIGIRPDGHVDAEVRRAVASLQGALAFKMTMVFPREGSWRLMLVAGRRRFNFPPVDVGSGQAPQDYVAFPVGSAAARQGAGGVYMEPEPVDTTHGGSLPPEVFNIADDAEWDEESDEEDGLATWWLFPVVGVVLAGAGIAVRVRR